MVALLVSLSGALVVAMVAYVPPLIGRDSGVRATDPGLLRVDPDAVGTVTLGQGRAVRLDESGLVITHEGLLLLRTVRGGSPISAVLGSVDGEGSDRREDVDEAIGNFLVDRLSITPGTARWSGQLVRGDRRMPASLSVRLDGAEILLDVEVEGADGVVVHTAQEVGTLGRRPVLPSRNLRRKAWWVPRGAPSGSGAFVTSLRTDVAIGPGGTDRAVDLRLSGRTDVHVWSDEVRLVLPSRRLRPS